MGDSIRSSTDPLVSERPATGVPDAPRLSAPESGTSGRAGSLATNAAWAAAGSMAYAGGQWLLLMVLAKLGSPDLLGRFAMGLALASPIILLTNLQLRPLQVVDARRAHAFGEFLALRLTTVLLALPAITGFGLLLRQPADLLPVILAVGTWKASDSVGEIAQGLFQQRERMDLVAWSQILRASIAVGALGMAMAWTHDLLTSVWIMAAAGCLAFVGFEFPAAARILGPADSGALWPHWKPREFARLVRRGLPLGVATMLSSLIVNIPRYAISRYHGERVLGSYAAIASLIVVVGLLSSALGQSASARLARLAVGGDWSEFHRLVSRLVLVACALGTAGLLASVLFGPAILTVLFDATYADAAGVFQVVMLASMIAGVATPLGFALTAGGHHAVQIPLLLVVVAGVAGCSRWLVPRHAALGGAWALVAGNLLLAGGCAAILAVAALRRRGAL